MALKKDGRQLLTVGKGTAAVLNGNDDVSDWDDEELAHGRRRDANGNFTGRPPRLIPHVCWVELKRRQLLDSDSAFGRSVLNATQYVVDVAEGRQEPIPYRMRACEIILDRFIGKPTERHQVDTKIELVDAPWAVALRNSIRGMRAQSPIPAASAEIGDDDIVDAELVDDLCACGCGQPRRPGSLYLNANHERHAKARAGVQDRLAPSEDDLKLWRRKHGATPPPTTAQGTYAGTPIPEDDVPTDPTLEDDDDDFIEDDDDPILWD